MHNPNRNNPFGKPVGSKTDKDIKLEEPVVAKEENLMMKKDYKKLYSTIVL